MREKLLISLKDLNEELGSHLESVAHKDEDWYHRAPQEGKWSPAQIHKHLILSEGLSAAYVAKKSQFPNGLRKVGLRERVKAEGLKRTLRSSRKFKAPPAVIPEDTCENLQMTVEVWMAQRQELRLLIEALPEELLGLNLYRHPFAGRLGLKQMLNFFSWHLKHHESQISY